mgnify:FL=1
MSEMKLRFKVCPVITRYGVRYIIKEDKLLGKYLRYVDGNQFTSVNKEQAQKFKRVETLVEHLQTAFGDDFTIVDNYL